MTETRMYNPVNFIFTQSMDVRKASGFYAGLRCQIIRSVRTSMNMLLVFCSWKFASSTYWLGKPKALRMRKVNSLKFFIEDQAYLHIGRWSTVCLFVFLIFRLFVDLSFRLFVGLPVCFFFFLPVCLFVFSSSSHFVSLSFRLFIFPSFRLSVCLPERSSVSLIIPVGLCVRPSVLVRPPVVFT